MAKADAITWTRGRELALAAYPCLCGRGSEIENSRLFPAIFASRDKQGGGHKLCLSPFRVCGVKDKG